MLKFVISSYKFYLRLTKCPILRKFVILDIESFTGLNASDAAVMMNELTFSGVFMTTVSGRFVDVDPISCDYIIELSKRGIVRVHDVGVSNGMTSIDFLETIENIGVRFIFTISDKFSVLTRHGVIVKRYYDGCKKFFQGRIGFIYADSSLSWKFALSKIAGIILRKISVRGQAVAVPVFSHKVMKAISEGRLNYLVFDVMSTKLDSEFDYVRCMNLLNKVYFSDDELVRGVCVLKDSLSENGVLQIGRTTAEGVNQVSFFRKEKDTLVHLYDMNGGSEVKSLIVGEIS